MARESLLEYFQPDSRPGNEPAFVWRRGYRTLRWTYADLFRAASQFAVELASRGVAKGDRVLLWGQNSGEWVAAFLGCLYCGALAVPMDATADPEFARRVARQAGVRLAWVGRELPSEDLAPQTLILEDIGPSDARSNARFSTVEARRSDPVEIVFTSGTTAEPRGVVLTHANLLASIAPIESEIARYRRYERFFHPLRFLVLLPLSHVFGQLLGIFIAQVIGATVVFADTLNPAEVMRTIHGERVSLLVTVPRLIESLQGQVERDLAARDKKERFERSFRRAEGERFLRRWWRFRKIRRRFGWRFWAMVSGGAALPPETDKFWTRLGYAVIQGYGLTETTSLVSVNHPFQIGRGSIGKSLLGMEVKLAPGGEILVRGENVASGYWQGSAVSSAADADGWFHTGDLGERDAQGNLYFKGRLKNVIVTPEGLNIYPQDLEAELRKEREIRDCVVIGLARDGNAEACAVLLLRDSADFAHAGAIVERANQRVAPFQRMRSWLVWHGKDFPRTPTQKPALATIQREAEAHLGRRATAQSDGSASGSPLSQILSRISGGAAPRHPNAKLQLSSIERVELLGALEDRYQTDLSETDFAKADTVGALEKLLDQPEGHAPVFHFPRWAQSWPARIFRALVFNLLGRPALYVLGWPTIVGRENLAGVQGPVLVVSNHVTYFDPACIFEGLPERLRSRLAVAMDGERLEWMRRPPRGAGLFWSLLNRAAYWLVIGVFNVFPLPRLSGFRKSFAFAGDLVDRGWSVLVFPEGERSRTTEMNPFRAGIGLLATRLRVPVIPMYLGGIAEVRAAGKHHARRGQVRIVIGAPVRYRDEQSAGQIALDLQERVAALRDAGNPRSSRGRKL